MGRNRGESDKGARDPRPRHVPSHYASESDTQALHARAGHFSATQKGLITTAQLLGAGLPSSTISRWVAAQRLHRMYRGVYLLGHPVPPPWAIELGAVLAYGRGAALSDRPAAVVLGFLPRDDGPMHVTLTRNARSHSGIRVHRARHLDAGTCHGIPVTSPLLTLFDLSRSAGARDLERAVDEALVQSLVDPDDLMRSPRIRRLLELQAGPSVTKSEAEAKLRQLIRDTKLPPALHNTEVAGRHVDAFWPPSLAVEVDSFKFHGTTPRKFRNDHDKTAALELAGIRLIRVTWWQLVDEPLATAARLGRALYATASVPPPAPSHSRPY